MADGPKTVAGSSGSPWTPAAIVATLQNPVWFDAPDNDPVDLLLAILWPKSDSAGFLPALARSCRLLRHPELRDRIRASDTPAEALAWMRSFEGRTIMETSGGNAVRTGRTYVQGLPWGVFAGAGQ